MATITVVSLQVLLEVKEEEKQRKRRGQNERKESKLYINIFVTAVINDILVIKVDVRCPYVFGRDVNP